MSGQRKEDILKITSSMPVNTALVVWHDGAGLHVMTYEIPRLKIRHVVKTRLSDFEKS